MLPAMAPPAPVKSPFANNLGPLPSSNTPRACTCVTAEGGATPVMPFPSADHCDPFHFAMLLVVTPAMLPKLPPTYRADPPPSSNTARHATTGLKKLPVIALPKPDQFDPSHFAMFLAVTPPAVANPPAAYSAGPAPSS